MKKYIIMCLLIVSCQQALADVHIRVVNTTDVNFKNVAVKYFSPGTLFNWTSYVNSSFSLPAYGEQTINSYDGYVDGQHGIYYISNINNISGANRCNMKKDGTATARITAAHIYKDSPIYDVEWDCPGGEILTGQFKDVNVNCHMGPVPALTHTAYGMVCDSN